MNNLVFLHGWGVDKSCFSSLLKYFDQENTIFFDLPGFGCETVPKRPWGILDYAEFAKDKIEPGSILIGYSFGGRVAISLAVNYPELVDKLVLIASGGLRKKFSLKRRINRLLKRDSRDYLSAGALRPTFVKVVNEDLKSELKKIKQKTLILWGEDDAELPLWMAKKMNKLVKKSKLIIMPGIDHYNILFSSQTAHHIKCFI